MPHFVQSMLLPEQDLIVPRLPHGIQRFKLRDHICTGANHSGKVADKEIGGGQFFENRKQIMHQLDAECVCPIFRFAVQRVPYKGIASVHLLTVETQQWYRGSSAAR